MFFPFKSIEASDPRGGAIFDLRVMLCRIYIKLHITMLKPNIEALSLVVSEMKIFSCISHYKLIADNDTRPQGEACMDPRGTVGRIYKEGHYTLLHTKYESPGPCGFREDFLGCFSPL